MGCGASTGVMRQESELNNNVENVKEDLNGQAQQVVVNAVQEQSKPVQPKQPDKPVSKPPPPEPENVEPTKEKSVKDEPSTKKSVPTYTEQSLQNVLNLEKKLSSMERKGVVGQYETQHKLLVSRYADLQATQKKVESLKQQTAKEYGDVAAIQHPNVRAMFSDVYQLQSRMAKEQREYMDALNRQEVAEKELKSQRQEYNALYAEVESLQKQCEELQRLREEHGEKLDEIFNGKYGSEVEEQLETEADLLTERKELIVRTRNYWNNAKVLMKHAAQQLAFSTRRWAQINTVNQCMVQARYSMVTETRNYLIAASQNITNTHSFLTNVTLPYFTSDSLKLLNHSISTIFNDVMTRESYMQALQTYSSFNKKANSLLLWITMVLEKNINKDLEQIVPLWKEKVLALKRERLRLIHVKIKELQGEDTSEDMPDEVLCLGNEPEQLTEMQSDTHIAKPDAVSLNEEPDVPPPLPGEESSSVPAHTSSSKESSSSEKDASLTSPVGKDDEGTPPPNTETNLSSRSTGDGEESPALTMATETTPDQPSKDVAETNETQEDDAKIAELLETAMKLKPLVELAPVPDMDVLFGNIEELKTKYEEQVAQFSKDQDVNKARLDQALQDKLQARRIRKQAIELKDTSELAKGVTSNVGKLF